MDADESQRGSISNQCCRACDKIGSGLLQLSVSQRLQIVVIANALNKRSIKVRKEKQLLAL